MQNENNIEAGKIKINDREIPLSITMNKIEEPYHTQFLHGSMEITNGIVQNICNTMAQENVKNITNISAKLKCYTYGETDLMHGAIDKVVLELSNKKQKEISIGQIFTLRFS